MRIAFNPYISKYQYQRPRKAQTGQTAVSFQAVPVKKIQSTKIFELEKALQSLWGKSKEEYLAKLKEFEHIDINSKDYHGDTIVTKAVKERSNFLSSLIWMEKRGEIEGVDWNATDANGDNILMLTAKTDDMGWHAMSNHCDVIKLAKEGKIDLNYINEKEGYSVIQCALIYARARLSGFLEIKDLDVNQVAKNSRVNTDSIIKLAISRAIFPSHFKELVCHPKMDFSRYLPQNLYKYIDQAPYDSRGYGVSDYWDHNTYNRCALGSYERREYKSAIEIGLKVANAKKTAKYYDENGILTLDQIERSIENADCDRGINYPLNSIDETIAHFLAETYVDPKDTYEVQRVKNIINKMRQSNCYFWQEDAIGRSPLMLALECENFVVARAMLEKMYDSEIKYYDFSTRSCLPCCAIQKSHIDHEKPLRELINNLEPSKREEFEQLLNERLQVRM